MCLRVHANGYGAGNGTHISVFVHLMRGGFDDCLKWPFQGDITIQLLNQEKHKDHVTEVITFDHHTTDRYANRVTKGERNRFGRGYHKFFPHTDLEPKYLKNGCIKFCISKIVLMNQ